jgi:hypothetical protein
MAYVKQATYSNSKLTAFNSTNVSRRRPLTQNPDIPPSSTR